MRTNCRCCDYRTIGWLPPVTNPTGDGYSVPEVWVCTRGVPPNNIIKNLDSVPHWCHRLLGCQRDDRPQTPNVHAHDISQRSIGEWC